MILEKLFLIKIMNNYLGLHFNMCFYITGSIWLIWFVFIKPFQKTNIDILGKIITFLGFNIKIENIFNPHTRSSIFILCFALFLIIYPLVNLLGIYESYSIDKVYSLSYIKDMELSRNILSMRFISFFTGLRLLIFLKINLLIDVDDEFKKYRNDWYLFMFQQYLFYLTVIILFFAINALNFDDYLIFQIKDFSINLSLIMPILSWAIAFCVGFIIDDWRIISDYMINSNGLIFEDQLVLIRRFNYIISTLVFILVVFNIKFLSQLRLTDVLDFYTFVLVFYLFFTTFILLEFIIIKKTEVSDIEDLEGVLRIDEAMKTQKAIKFRNNS